MKKIIALMVWGLVICTPAAMGENDGAQSLDSAPQIYRLPQNDGGDGLIELRANNIQVQAEWSINPDAPFDVDNGKLHYKDGVIVPPATVTVMVTVEDNFKLLNPSYENLAATAIITIAFLPYPPRIFVMEGSNDTSYYKDVWLSYDNGQNWSGESPPGWSGRRKFQAVVHNGSIYVLGGSQGINSRLNDVWSSTDGKTWTLLVTANWAARNDHQAVVHNGTIYVLGGTTEDGQENDVWSSVDGITWSAIQLTANWGKREGHQVVSHNGRLYVLGGLDKDTSWLRDVWSSTDGITWVPETANTGWPYRRDFQAVSHNGKIYMLGGAFLSSDANDVWSSVDGKMWSLETADAGAEWEGRSLFQVFSHNDLLYILGGFRSGGVGAVDDVWSSRGGQNWTLVKGNAEWPARSSFQTVILP